MQNEPWLFIGLFLVLAPVFPAVALLIPRLIAPKKPNVIKSQTPKQNKSGEEENTSGPKSGPPPITAKKR